MAGSNAMNDYIAGAIGGCAGMVVGHPLDTVKVQMQTQSPQNAYKGTWDCIKSISHQNLWRGFFRGMSWPLVSFGFMNSAFFGVYGQVLHMLGGNINPDSEPEEIVEPHYWDTFTAGFVATFPTVLMACPIEVVKVTLQSQIEHEVCPSTGVKTQRTFYSGPMQAMIEILKRSGYRGIYRGFWTQLARDCPANAVYMSFYEYSTFQCAAYLPSIPAPVVNFVGGGIAGVLSWLVILPLDVVKSRMQADFSGKRYKGFFDCALKAYREEGFRVFYRGGVAISLRAFPVNAVTLMVYTEVLKKLNKENPSVSVRSVDPRIRRYLDPGDSF